jgi:hypothetical protein
MAPNLFSADHLDPMVQCVCVHTCVCVHVRVCTHTCVYAYVPYTFLNAGCIGVFSKSSALRAQSNNAIMLKLQTIITTS